MSPASTPVVTPARPGTAPSRPPLPAGPYLVMGLGRAGQAALGVLERLAPPTGLAVWDGRRTPHTAPLRRRLQERGITVRVGGHPADAELAMRPGCVIKSPGIPPWAARPEVTVIDELELGWRLGSAPVVGVTGTDGKSTTAALLSHVLRICAGTQAVVTGNFDLHEPYSAVEQPTDGWVICEASSYQLEGCPAFLPEVAVLTNLSHDHLHRHGTMAAYGECKRRMFVRPRGAAPVAVINLEQPFGRRLAADVKASGARVVSYGAHPQATHRILGCSWGLDGTTFELATPDGVLSPWVGLPGLHNAVNAAAAIAAADALGIPPTMSAEALRSVPRLPGRFEAVDEGQGFEAIVDFAHTPAAIVAVTQTARTVLGDRGSGRLVVVAGTAGNVDPSKRGAMGRAARALADHLFVTVNNPRGGDPQRLVADLAHGALTGGGGNVTCEPDRRAAIQGAVRMARPGDILLILGRGATTHRTETVGGTPVAFDDRKVLREELSRP